MGRRRAARTPKPRRRSRVGLAALTAALTLGGVTAVSASAATTSHAETTPGTLVIATTGLPPTIDADSFLGNESEYTLSNMYGTLVQWDDISPTANEVPSPSDIRPELATWKTLSNGDIEFTLLNVRSSAGNQLTTQDVAWSIKRWIATFVVNKILLSEAQVNINDPIKVLSTTQFILNVTHPSALVLPELTLWLFPIFDYQAIKPHITAKDPYATKWMTTHDPSTFGPYYATSFTPTERLVLAANPNFPGGEPAIHTVIWDGVADNSTRLLLLKSGQAQYATDLAYSQLVSIAADRNLSVYSLRSDQTDSITFDTTGTSNPFSNVLVRRAVSEAIDRKLLVSAAYGGFGQASVGYESSAFSPNIQPTSPYITYNPSGAKALLAQAGYPNGFSTSLAINAEDGPGSEDVVLGTLVAGMLSNVGIQVSIDNVASASTYEGEQASGAYPMSFIPEAPAVADAGYYIYLDWSAPNPLFSNTDLSTLASEIVAKPLGAARNSLVRQAETLLNDVLPEAPLVEYRIGVATSANLTGISDNSVWFPALQYLSFTS